MCGFAVNERILLLKDTLVGEICCETATETPQVAYSLAPDVKWERRGTRTGCIETSLTCGQIAYIVPRDVDTETTRTRSRTCMFVVHSLRTVHSVV